MKTIPAAYTWDDAQHAKGRIAVRIGRPETPAARVAKLVKAYFSKREGAYIMRPAQFRRFQQAYARACKHPPARNYAWLVETTIYTGCCDCGTILLEKDLAQPKSRRRK